MKSKLLMLLLAGFSMIMLPACGDDDDDAKSDSLEFSAITGTYHGTLSTSGAPVADNLGVVVSANAETENAIDLTLEPITIMGIEVKDLDFKALPSRMMRLQTHGRSLQTTCMLLCRAALLRLTLMLSKVHSLRMASWISPSTLTQERLILRWITMEKNNFRLVYAKWEAAQVWAAFLFLVFEFQL